ncbi:hypothetical protein K435DRAFT_859902 [Dendrothele bispora CBS 962.96]|uniref:Uncharacterized protein n=1 Tax=Dendrothele bispora (strain CBS 962.96) TaxID=1314807 RepID=A0A4S8M0K0_DENBC|nr:hypothetical protein K435DRAFT_859902 [Dendrothele bispora CBS 962.96]
MPPKTVAFKPSRKAVEQAKKNIKTTSHVESDGSPLRPKKTSSSTPRPASPVKSSSRPYTRTNGHIQAVSSPTLPENGDTDQPEALDETIASSQETDSGSAERTGRYQGASEFMRPFLGRLGSFVRYLLHKEEPKGLLQRCECGLDVRDDPVS